MSRPTWLFPLLMVFFASGCAVSVAAPDDQDPGASAESLGDAPPAPAQPTPQQARVSTAKPTPDPWGAVMDPVKPTPDPWRTGQQPGSSSDPSGTGSNSNSNNDSNGGDTSTQQSSTTAQAGH